VGGAAAALPAEDVDVPPLFPPSAFVVVVVVVVRGGWDTVTMNCTFSTPTHSRSASKYPFWESSCCRNARRADVP